MCVCDLMFFCKHLRRAGVVEERHGKKQIPLTRDLRYGAAGPVDAASGSDVAL